MNKNHNRKKVYYKPKSENIQKLLLFLKKNKKNETSIL